MAEGMGFEPTIRG